MAMFQMKGAPQFGVSDTICISQAAADGLSAIGIGDFQTVELLERMAWVVLILKALNDKPEWFPKGKWALIQHIENHLEAAAQNIADQL